MRDGLEGIRSLVVLQRPPRLSCSSRVSLESRYGTRPCFSRSAVTTRPSVSRDWLIFCASRMRALSCDPVPADLAHSLPARSTMCNYATRVLSTSSQTYMRVRGQAGEERVWGTGEPDPDISAQRATLPILAISAPSDVRSFAWTVRVNRQCERDEALFILVSPIFRRSAAMCRAVAPRSALSDGSAARRGTLRA